MKELITIDAVRISDFALSAKSEEISNSLEEHTRICFFVFVFVCLFVYRKGMVDIESSSFFNFFYYVFILVALQDYGSIYVHFSKNNV